jgi:hypothetical protein
MLCIPTGRLRADVPARLRRGRAGVLGVAHAPIAPTACAGGRTATPARSNMTVPCNWATRMTIGARSGASPSASSVTWQTPTATIVGRGRPASRANASTLATRSASRPARLQMRPSARSAASRIFAGPEAAR